ncbi:uncharacterized protein LOC131328342 [Rhododendron vialii]|uniref:uncharacterized protein LOC131328342 n=1 Tax=Rhododendron vialii TaxID=182163 RepID=UPI00265D700B|nr:uncharacterized protein LOC131328342 [Rhododendron vialii]
MKENRPIACCNVIYKTITKLLARRLQPVLPFVINKAQAAFVKGRSISDSFFKGEKGLRQADSISPYLFLLVMEGLYSILQRRISQGPFTFHPKCSLHSISFLAFTDDLFLLAGADPSSIRIINDALEEFFHSSGLKPNLDKSQFFFAGKIIKEVEAMLRSFFGSGLNLTKVGEKVSWFAVCTPKAEGGLGLKSLRHLWALCKRENNLWVKWIHSYFIKDQNFWVMKLPQDCSWTMRKLMKLRGLCQSWVKHVIGNGQRTFLWFDNWHPSGPLYKLFSDHAFANLGRSSSAKVSSVIWNGE